MNPLLELVVVDHDRDALLLKRLALVDTFPDTRVLGFQSGVAAVQYVTRTAVNAVPLESAGQTVIAFVRGAECSN
jgi:hypothetical protein